MSVVSRPRALAEAPALRSLRVRNFRLFAAGNVISNVGTWMQLVAQNWLVLRLTGSPSAVGLTVALQSFPSAILGLAGGVVADRASRRHLLLGLQVAWISLSVTLGTLVATGGVRVWMLYVGAVVAGVLNAVEAPTNAAFGPELVDPDDLPNAIAIGSVISSTGRIVGMAFAGVVVAGAGVAAAFFFNAATFLAVVAALSAMSASELRPAKRAPSAPGQLREGILHVVGSPVLLTTIALAGSLSLFGRNYQVTLAAMSDGPLAAGAAGYAAASTAFAIGAVLGAMWTARLPRATHRVLLVAAAGTGALQIGAALVPAIQLLVAVVLPIAAGAVVVDTMTASLTQLATRDELRGRVAAIVGLASTGGAAAGAVFLGWLSGAAGVRVALAAGGVLVLVAVGVAGSRLYGLRPLAPLSSSAPAAVV